MKSILFPGAFDPPTLGHLDLISRASKICDTLYIGVADNTNKPPGAFTADEKISMLRTITSKLPNIEVITFPGLVIDYVKQNNIDCIIRGLRAFSDFEYEFKMALANRKMSDIETLFLMTDERYAYMSSSLIREVALHQHRLHEFVPEELEAFIYEKLAKQP